MRVLVDAAGRLETVTGPGGTLGVKVMDDHGDTSFAALADVSEEVVTPEGAVLQVLAGGPCVAQDAPRVSVAPMTPSVPTAASEARLRALEAQLQSWRLRAQELEAAGRDGEGIRARAEEVLASVPRGSGLVPLADLQGQSSPLLRWLCRAFWCSAWTFSVMDWFWLRGHVSIPLSGLAAAGFACTVLDSWWRESHVAQAWRPVVRDGKYTVRVNGIGDSEVACTRGGVTSWRQIGEFVALPERPAAPG